ncbi:hypothetical protein NDU88_004667 [Pleurodeles waltl]|uniref:Uncharacterized protein n=1 Tax=Pleurodeles waltl TaxID=8319 RepID=A0AAV7VKH5_PLEWA|nr:hypothetical protein NDU88_004667 [Pleurodeles waltl]
MPEDEPPDVHPANGPTHMFLERAALFTDLYSSHVGEGQEIGMMTPCGGWKVGLLICGGVLWPGTVSTDESPGARSASGSTREALKREAYLHTQQTGHMWESQEVGAKPQCG